MIMWRRLFILAVAAVVVIVTTKSAEAALRHWYIPSGRGVGPLVDLAGNADGTLSGNATLSASGLELNLAAGTRDGLASLLTSATDAVNGIDIQSYSALTVDLWATPATDAATPHPNSSFSTAVGLGKVNTTDAGLAAEYFILQTHRGDNVSRTALSFSDDGSPWDEEEGANGPELNDGAMHHYRAVVTGTFIQLYVDGVSTAVTPLVTNSLASVANEYAWLGDAYPNDQNWAGTIKELRIYDHALPEPATLALLGLAGLAILGWRQRS